MKRKIALYNPYLDVMGGGERHILSVLKVFADHDYTPTIFWDKNVNPSIKNNLNLEFSEPIKYETNIFKKNATLLYKLQKLKEFDLFLYVTNGSYFFSSAKKNYVFCMVPLQEMYNMSALNKLKTLNYSFISNSHYTASWLKKWEITSDVLYPYIDDDFLNTDLNRQRKDKTIVIVGRFFRHLHAKRQDVAIKTFLQLKKIHPDFHDYTLILAGSVKSEDQDYYDELIALANSDKSIILKPNVPYQELLKIYKSARFYWHFTGYDVDENLHPEQVEHLGITPLEAMASGCVTFCYNAGGPREIITEGKNGYLFKSQSELVNKMQSILGKDNKPLQMEAQNYVRTNFSYEVFKKNIMKIFNII